MGISKVAAQNGISQVIFSRVIMAAPGMGTFACFINFSIKAVFTISSVGAICNQLPRPSRNSM